MSNLDYSQLSPADLEIALDGPAIKPPDGITPNFENPRNKDTISLVSIYLCLVVGSASLGIRIYMKFVKLKQRHIGDYLMILAYPFWIVTAVGSLRRIYGATGIFIHEWDFRGRDIPEYMKVIFMGMCFWAASTALMKSAILLEWIHIFSSTNKRTPFHRCCTILLIFTPLFYGSLIISLNLSCIPYSRIWDKTVPGTCKVSLQAVNIAATAINVVLDIVILVLPQRMIWELKMTRAKKIGLSAVFAFGIFACIAAIFLLASIVNWVKSNDLTYHYSAVALWAIAESTCGTMIFSALVIPKLFKSLKSRWNSRVSSSAVWPMNYIRRSVRKNENVWNPKGIGSDSREYRHIDESNSIVLSRFESARPTDQQYGIVCTTDILVTESREDDFPGGKQGKQNSWLPSVQENRG
ncbi:hypothetical protein F4811DRAFT_66502 [Daldinia bambusicola]|nr:hypothetical protein F4811DRAFT_66502 [Daldinia bambusicola]